MSTKYADAVYGNLAYKSTAAQVPARELDRPIRPAERENEIIYEESKVRVRQKPKTIQKQGISVFAIMGCVCVAGLFFLILLSYVSLAEISQKSVELTNELSTLKTEETRLQLDYESAFDLNEIEAYAINILGMTKAGENQVYYIQRSAGDQAIVLDTEQNESGILNSLSTLLTTLAGYFN